MRLVRVTDLFLQNPGDLQGAKAGEKEGATARDWREGTTDEERRHPWDEHGVPREAVKANSITGQWTSQLSHP